MNEELPGMYEAVLDAERFASLLCDLEALPALEVAIKRAAHSLVDDQVRPSLRDALALMEQGAVRAFQVRYVHEGRAWIDTIMRVAEGHRLVRIAAPTG